MYKRMYVYIKLFICLKYKKYITRNKNLAEKGYISVYNTKNP